MHVQLSRYVLVPALVPAFLATFAAVLPAASASAAPAVWDRVAACESGGNWSINTGNGYYGGVQFDSVTWAAYGGHAYASQANGASKDAQILIAQRVLAAQGPNAWPVCGPRAGLTRSGGMDVSRNYNRPPITSNQLVVDGVMGPLTHAQMNRHGIVLTAWATRVWQARLGVHVDGVVGPVTVRALQGWMNSH